MRKPALTRFSISMDGGLAEQLDVMARAKGYPNRSRAVADMVRSQLVEHRAQASGREIVGSISLVYDHHKRNAQALLTEIQHDHHHLITAGVHVHLDAHNCMEVLVVRGRAGAVRRLAHRLLGTKGVQHVRLEVIGASAPEGQGRKRRKGSHHAHG